MPLDTLAQTHGGLDDFRITSPVEIKAMLRKLADSNTPLHINAPDGSALSASLWTVDSLRGAISFSASLDDPQLQHIVHCDEAVVVGYMDSVKLQFDAVDMVVVHGARESALSCAFPEVIYRFQRRGSFRVRPVLRSTPLVRFRHPEMPDMSLSLRVLDVSLGGCALFVPQDVPPLTPGVTLNGVELELDGDTHFTATMRLQHLSSLESGANGMRAGCELLRLQSDSERQLQRYIDQTQKRRRLMALD